MSRLCSIEGCNSSVLAKGLCRRHYRNRPEASRCSVRGCDKSANSRGMCSAHANRLKRHGDPTAGRHPYGEIDAFFHQILCSETDDCILWPYARSSRGYAVWAPRVGLSQYVHREVCKAAHGLPGTPSLHAAHSCGRGHEGCVNPRHLRWATAKENSADRILHGTHIVGEAVNTARLTASDVMELREKFKNGDTSAVLAKRFGISQQHAHDVAVGRKWKHLPL